MMTGRGVDDGIWLRIIITRMREVGSMNPSYSYFTHLATALLMRAMCSLGTIIG